MLRHLHGHLTVTPAENIIPFSVLLVQDITRAVISWARAKH